ncbi:MAG: SH3 domain-containing protein [Nocardioidaceae bacterium]
MARARHKHVLRAIRPRRRRLLRGGLAGAAVATLATSAAAVGWADEAPTQSASAISMAAPSVRPVPVPVRVAPISRSEDRIRLVEKPPEVTDHMFATDALNVRREPTEKAPVLDVLEWADKVAVSGETRGEWAEIVIEKKSFWVHADYLADTKPKPEPEPAESSDSGVTSGLSSAACATGSDVEAGLVPNAIAVHRAVCAAFPEVSTYGGLRPGDDGEHGTGQALDIMVTGSTGDQIAEFVRANASALGVSEVLWSQQIWTVERSSEGWRYMEDMGSTTANHYDHVHVTVY